MSRLIVVALIAVLSFGSYAGFDAGGGGGKIAIALRNRVIHHDNIIDDEQNHLSLGVEHFRDVVVINASAKELIIDTNQIGIACPSNSDTALAAQIADPIVRFKPMADEGDVTVLLIDFKSFKQEDGKLTLKLKDNWGSSLKVYQIRQGGEIIQQDSEDAFELKSWTEVETNFSVHLFLDPVVAPTPTVEEDFGY